MVNTSKSASLEELVSTVEQPQLSGQTQEIRPGATVAVHQRILEKGKVRIQIFEGVVLKSVRRAKLGASVLVRKVANGVGVERTFFLNSPIIEKVVIKKQAKVRRAKLYYLRGLSGRAAVQREAQSAQPAPQKNSA